MNVNANPLHDTGFGFGGGDGDWPRPHFYEHQGGTRTGSGLYDNERGSDVHFVAGLDSDTWRFPGHRRVLAESNSVFRAMLFGPLYHGEDVICVRDVDKRAFEQLLRFLYGQPVKLPSVATARATLEAAHKYLCAGLVMRCVRHLDEHLSPATVLEVFQDLRFFCSSRVPTAACGDDALPSAPPYSGVADADAESEAGRMTELCDSLMHNCLLFVDEHADEVLRQERVEELSYYDLEMLANRATLRLSSETELFDALARWARSECKRRKRELTAENRRQVLGELSYAPRYLLMSESEFARGPRASELLDAVECGLVLARMRGDPLLGDAATPEQREMLARFSTPRAAHSPLDPVHLSVRSRPRPPPEQPPQPDPSCDEELDNDLNSKAKKSKKKNKKDKKEKKGKKSRSRNNNNEGEEKDKLPDDAADGGKGCSCSCFGEGLLRAFVCMFD